MRSFLRLSPLLALLAISAPISGRGQQESLFPGHSPFPAFSGRGELAVIFRDAGERLGLAGYIGSRPDYTTHSLSGRLLTQAPILRKDRSGGLWAAWGEEGPAGNEIRLARLLDRRLETILKSRIGTDFPVSLDLAFDRANRPWLAGVFYSGLSYSVRVWSPRRGAFLTIASSENEISCARLAAGLSRLWAFWTQDAPGRSEIFAASWIDDGDAFSSPEPIAPASASPRLFLQAAADEEGRPWLVWSGFDGNDYEVQAACRDGNRWRTGSALTDNGDQDFFPSLVFLPDGSPLVIWYRSGSGNGHILARLRSGGAWGREITLATTEAPLSRPIRAAADAGRLALAWEEKEAVRTAVIDIAALAGLPSPPPSAPPSRASRGEAGVEDTYIGFGDSITYGVIDNQYAPERGYIPRLAALLETRFGAASIVNEGLPGEITVNGLGRMGPVLAAHPARYLLLMEGTNDVIFSEIAMSATAFHLKLITDKALGAGVYPILATIIPRSDWRWALKFYRDRIFSLNDMIRALAQNLKLPLAEQFYAFYDYPEADGGWRSLLSDKVHPTDKGYEIMTRTWYDEVIVLPFGPASPAVERTTQRSLLMSRPVNRLTWAHNPKVLHPIVLIGYNVFRNEDHSPQEGLTFLARYPITGVAERFRYVDALIDPARRYIYYIQAVRRDGVEGPLSEAIHD